VDNAKYHNVFVESAFPVPSNRKRVLCEGLEKNNIPWTKDMLKLARYELCKRFASAPKYNRD